MEAAHISLGPVISHVGTKLMFTVFEHCAATPFNVVIRLSVKLPTPLTLTLTDGPVFGPMIVAPVTVHK